MQVRLAFAVMVHVDADVLLIDEVLAVGDAAFQQKCHDALQPCARRGPDDPARHPRHEPGPALLRPRAAARTRRDGRPSATPREVTERYVELNFATPRVSRPLEPIAASTPDGGGEAAIVDLWLQDAAGRRTEVLEQGRPCALCMRVRFREPADEPGLRLRRLRRAGPARARARQRRNGTADRLVHRGRSGRRRASASTACWPRAATRVARRSCARARAGADGHREHGALVRRDRPAA